jgi:hypothetical protein
MTTMPLHYQAFVSYSPDDEGGRVRSPEYIPVSSLWAGKQPVGQAIAQAGPFPTTGQEEVLFGPGVQLRVDTQVAEISDRVTQMDIDTAPRPGAELQAGDGTTHYWSRLLCRGAPGFWQSLSDPRQSLCRAQLSAKRPRRKSDRQSLLCREPFIGLLAKALPRAHTALGNEKTPLTGRYR